MNEKNQIVKGALSSAGVEFEYEYAFQNADWGVRFKGDKYVKLYREGEDLLKDVNATSCDSNSDSTWWYEDELGKREMAKDERIVKTYEQGILEGRRQLLAEINELKKQ